MRNDVGRKFACSKSTMVTRLEGSSPSSMIKFRRFISPKQSRMSSDTRSMGG